VLGFVSPTALPECAGSAKYGFPCWSNARYCPRLTVRFDNEDAASAHSRREKVLAKKRSMDRGRKRIASGSRAMCWAC